MKISSETMCIRMVGKNMLTFLHFSHGRQRSEAESQQQYAYMLKLLRIYANTWAAAKLRQKQSANIMVLLLFTEDISFSE